MPSNFLSWRMKSSTEIWASQCIRTEVPLTDIEIRSTVASGYLTSTRSHHTLSPTAWTRYVGGQASRCRLIYIQFDLTGKVAVVTGAARGLGLAFTEVLAAVGCNIAGLDIQLELSPALCELQTKHKILVKYYQVDVTSETNIRAVVI